MKESMKHMSEEELLEEIKYLSSPNKDGRSSRAIFRICNILAERRRIRKKHAKMRRNIKTLRKSALRRCEVIHPENGSWVLADARGTGNGGYSIAFTAGPLNDIGRRAFEVFSDEMTFGQFRRALQSGEVI